jgi:hypothetical protein
MIALVSLNMYLLTDLEFLHSIMLLILYLGFIYPPPKNFFIANKMMTSWLFWAISKEESHRW